MATPQPQPQPQPQPCQPKPSACRTPLLPESPLQVKVVGLFKSSSFQMSKTIAEVTLTPPLPSLYEHRSPLPRFRQRWRVCVLSSGWTLKHNYPSRFEDPVIVPLQEFAWDQYLQEKKRELKGETWVYSSYVMCFINDQLLGNAFDLKKWAQKVWDVVDVRPSALYEALTLNYSTKFLKDTKASYTGF
ncbi:Peptidyl-prolyl cis-trans isomerase-like 6 [Microtus ochrogaster]|uniref:Peptidyl-prolyl cis-trans isomerase-like 6 n=1 Tax=Microtus ochrogaster TaxID=79684 RepID=A0A8J6GDE9_MICOH|nr:Peptidyl-prolyl cis-trans isomerase-like 6 [Microtus ochrogaster]